MFIYPSQKKCTACLELCAGCLYLAAIQCLLYFFSSILFLELFMNIRPLHDRVVIKRLEAEEKTSSGIILAPSATEKPDMGEVIAVGAGKIGKDGSRRALDVKVGDKVIFGKYSGQTVKADGVELLVMREEDIFGIVE